MQTSTLYEVGRPPMRWRSTARSFRRSRRATAIAQRRLRASTGARTLTLRKEMLREQLRRNRAEGDSGSGPGT